MILNHVFGFLSSGYSNGAAYAERTSPGDKFLSRIQRAHIEEFYPEILENLCSTLPTVSWGGKVPTRIEFLARFSFRIQSQYNYWLASFRCKYRRYVL